MKKIIVTGATSFIGVHLIKKLLNQGFEIYAVIRPGSSNIDRLPVSDKLKIIELEISRMHEISEQITDNIDVFYHLAWEGARAPHRDDSVMQEVNYQGAVEAMKAAVKLGASLFVGSGSQAEYGRFNGKVDETYPCNPITEYGKSKYHAYLTLKDMAAESGMRFIWTRIFSVYGQYDYEKTLIMSSIGKMLKNEPMDMTECVQNWDFTHVEDVAEALNSFIDCVCEDGVYNIATGQARPLKSFVQEIKRITDSQSQLNFGVVSYGSEGPVSFEPVVSKLMNNLGWQPEISFEDGIRKLLTQYPE